MIAMNELSRTAVPWAARGPVFSQPGLARPVAWATPHDLDRLRASHARGQRGEPLVPTSVASPSLGMEPIFGAFIAGTVISASRIAQRQLAALRTLVLSVLAPLFLATAGLRVDVTVLARPVVALTALVIVLVAIFGNFAGAYAGARLRRLSSREGIALGAGMNAAASSRWSSLSPACALAYSTPRRTRSWSWSRS